MHERTEIIYMTREQASELFGKGDYPERVAIERKWREAREGENYQAVTLYGGIKLVQEPLKIVTTH